MVRPRKEWGKLGGSSGHGLSVGFLEASGWLLRKQGYAPTARSSGGTFHGLCLSHEEREGAVMPQIDQPVIVTLPFVTTFDTLPFTDIYI